MTAKVLRNIDPELWRRFKARAAIEGRTMNDVVNELLRAYVEAPPLGDSPPPR